MTDNTSDQAVQPTSKREHELHASSLAEGWLKSGIHPTKVAIEVMTRFGASLDFDSVTAMVQDARDRIVMNSEYDVEAERVGLVETFRGILHDAVLSGDARSAISAGREFGAMLDLYPDKSVKGANLIDRASRLAAEVLGERTIEVGEDGVARQIGIAKNPHAGQDVVDIAPERKDG